jgi:hypothetical protein
MVMPEEIAYRMDYITAGDLSGWRARCAAAPTPVLHVLEEDR